jgi:hypothetical protein
MEAMEKMNQKFKEDEDEQNRATFHYYRKTF